MIDTKKENSGGKNLPKKNVGFMMCEHENFLIVVLY